MTPLQHLLMAHRVHDRLGWDTLYRPELLLGAISPDAHRLTPRVSYRDLHFRSRSTEGKRLIDFLHECLRPAIHGPQDELHFWTGWLSHIVGDDVWRLRLRDHAPEMWDAVVHGDPSTAREMRALYEQECNRLDVELFAEESQVMGDIRTDLQNADPDFSVPELGVEDIHDWRITVVQSMLPPLAEGARELAYLSVEFVDACMRQAVEETYRILEWESEDSDLSPVF